MPTIRTPYTDQTISRRVVSKMITMIDWTQAPLLRRLGIENESTTDFHNWPPGNSKKIEWLEDTMPSTQTTLASAISNTTTPTINLTNGEYVHQGTILQIDDEYMVVQDRSGNTVTSTRGVAGTTPATHTNGTAVFLRGIAKKTGANYAIGNTTDITAPFNWAQIIEEAVQVNEDQQIADDYGIDDTMAYHLAKLIGGNAAVGSRGRAGVLVLQLGRMAYYGKKQQPNDDTEGMAGGLDEFISTNLYGNTSTALSRPTIHQALRDIYKAGGMPDLMVVSPWAAEVVTEMYEDLVTTEVSEERGGAVITYIKTPVVDRVELLIDHQLDDERSYILDSEKAGWLTIRPFEPKEKPSLGDYKVMSVLGEYSFCVKNEQSHAKITHAGE